MTYAFNDTKLAIHLEKPDEAIKILQGLKENDLDWIKIKKVKNIIVSIIIDGEYQLTGSDK